MKVDKLKFAVLGALMLPLSAVVVAEEAKSAFSVSGNVGLYSDYIFRGYTQTKNDPALQGGFDIEHESGAYAGVWASNVNWTTEGGYMTDNSLELDFYGGFAGSLGETGIGYDVGILKFYYPGDNLDNVNSANGAGAGGPDTDATEVYASLSKQIGPVSASLGVYYVVSDDAWGFADADGSKYYTADVDVPIGETSLTASVHVGRQTFEGVGNDPYDYTDWKVNLEYAVNDTFALGGFYTDTNQKVGSWTVNNVYLGDGTGGVYLSAGF
tara:strand:- start:48 stop:854 length:807 start_codon:yes stop_codon:yes gene_type:complete